MYAEDELLPISALQHLLFCERQCALIHLERVWEENRFTAEGRILHERIEEGGGTSRGKIRIEYSVPLRSFRLGVAGLADVVEFHNDPRGRRVLPVEYKRGRTKLGPWDEVQLCAQAMCLEEMLRVRIESGALYYGKTRHRKDVHFTEILRGMTEKAADSVHALFEKRVTPRAIVGDKCKMCSLYNLCMPESSARFQSAADYLMQAIGSAEMREIPG